jgi:CxxC motif-containing protein (DUF1111 family)
MIAHVSNLLGAVACAPACDVCLAASAPGGTATVALGASPSFARPAANLDDARKADFYAGRALAAQPWVRAPTTTDARDGLGPLYNAHRCLSCHVEGGYGDTTLDDSTPAVATVVRLGVPNPAHRGAVLDEPVYGAQLQTQSTSLAHELRARLGDAAPAQESDEPAPEGTVRLAWRTEIFAYADGREVTLRRPTIVLDHLAYGPLADDTRLGLRHPPSMAGTGLLEAIPDDAILALVDEDDSDGDGISGRAHFVVDAETGAKRLGRFGRKATRPSVRVQVAAALHDDMGIKSSIFATQPCTERQLACLRAPHGDDDDGLEISSPLLALLVDFTRSLGVHARRKPDDDTVREGERHFTAAGCARCHTPSFVTGGVADAPHLSRQVIWPYTDLLLHDMGEGLAEALVDGDASGREWRTAPLWGIGLARALSKKTGYLHDGRARSIEEAILWHGGEAARAKDAFAALSVDERRALISFVRSL